MLSRLGLGTVQFGMHYGVSNRNGRPAETDVAAILDRAESAGTGYLDTAFTYPNSEALIGRHLAPGSRMKIITKTPPLDGAVIDRAQGAAVLEALAGSMERLRADRLHGLLIHRATDLAKPGWEYLVDALGEARARGWVSHIGASVYDETQLELVESRFSPDIIQGPFNALDVRLVSSACFARLRKNGTRMHARSIFLQGLLLMQPSALPAFFEPIKASLASLHASWTDNGVSPLAACLATALDHPDIDAVIVGVNGPAEFEEIRSVAAAPRCARARSGGEPSIEARYLDPSQWPSFPN